MYFGQVSGPRLHYLAPLFEKVAAGISSFDIGTDYMRQSVLGYIIWKAGPFLRPCPERRAEAVHIDGEATVSYTHLTLPTSDLV